MTSESSQKIDPVARNLRIYAQNILVIFFGLLPIVFIPSTSAPYEYTKVLIVIAGLLAALVLYSLSVLRSGTVHVGISYPLCALWAVAGVSVVSSLLSGDFKDAFIGDFFSIHSALFTVVLASIPTVWMLLRPSKASVMKMYVLLAASTIILVIFHILRLVFGADFLSLGLFTNSVSTPVGTWNDLALFLGLSIILSLVALEQMQLTPTGRMLFGVVTVLSLIMLSVINFFTVWLVLGLSSIALVVYTLGKDRFTDAQPALIASKQSGPTSLMVSFLVFVVSLIFIIGGSTVGGWISGFTNVSYVEVRPSFEATTNIARNVYDENAILGIGTNKFSDAWRLYKDESINATAFWNTDFTAGNGYITTFFVTTGVLGGIAWLLFLVVYLITGLQRLLRTANGDRIWYFIGVSSFVSALYIWGMSLVYVPGTVVLLLGALCTGVSLYAFTVLSDKPAFEIAVGNNRRASFILTLCIIVIIVGSVSALYMTLRHYSSVYTFNESLQALASGESIDALEQKTMNAYALASNDVFARRIAEYQLERLNSLSQVAEPTEAQAQEFNTAMVNGVRFAQEAIRIDPEEPSNWAVLAGIYNVLAAMNVEGALERVREALTKSQELNPKNPLPYLESAIVEARAGNYDAARASIEKAITLKGNFSEAYYLLSQLAVVEGNVEEAVQSTKAVIALEPENPIRYYQLGVLESSRNNIDAAISAFLAAIERDENYANARYLLALAYDLDGSTALAREQLAKVLELNPDNADVQELIRVIDTEGSLARLRSEVDTTVPESTGAASGTGNARTTKDADTGLVTPVNTTPKDTQAE